MQRAGSTSRVGGCAQGQPRRPGAAIVCKSIEVKVLTCIVFCVVAFVGSLSLSACTTWKPVVLPSGQHGFTVDCSGTNLSWSHCYQKAGKACPHGYNVTQRMDAKGSKLVPGDLYGVLGGSVQDRSLLIECTNNAAPVTAAAPTLQPMPAGATTYPASSG